MSPVDPEITNDVPSTNVTAFALPITALSSAKVHGDSDSASDALTCDPFVSRAAACAHTAACPHLHPRRSR